MQPYRLSHRTQLIDCLLRRHAYPEAEDAIAAALQVFQDEESRGTLGALKARLSQLRAEEYRSPEPRGVRTEFVGRTSEFSALASAWRGARKGSAQVGLIQGPPGIGKTRLGEELIPVVEVDEGRVVDVKAAEVERNLDWGTVTQLVRVLHGLPGAAGISNRSAAILGSLVPSLAGLQATGGDQAIPPGSQPAAVADALLDLVAAVAEEMPLFILVDDLQWVDKKSRAVLSHLGRSLAGDPVLLLFTSRRGDRDPEVEKAVESIAGIAGANSMELGPLQPPEVAELLTLFLEEMPPEDLDRFSSRVYGISQGNPLFLVEILKLLHAEGLLVPNGAGRWSLDPTCLSGRLPVPESVEAAIERRLAELGEHGRIIAAYLAQQARPMDTEEIRRLSGLDPFEVSEGTRQLFQLELVHRTSEGRLAFVHDSMTAVVRRAFSEIMGGINGGRAQGWRHRWIGVVAAAAAVLVLSLALLEMSGGDDAPSIYRRLSGASAPSYPFGKGRLFVRTDEGAFWVTPPGWDGEGWTTERAPLPYPHARLWGPFRMPDGEFAWFARGADGPRDPPYFGIPSSNGAVDPIRKIAGDVGFSDLSPDGSRILFWEENLATEQYDRNLMLLNGQGEPPRVLYQSPDQLSSPDWSPDGNRIAFVESVSASLIVLLDPLGNVVQTFPLPEEERVGRLSWCSDSRHLALITQAEGRSSVAVLDTESGSITSTPSLVGDGGIVCLGAAAALAFPGASGTEPQLLIRNLAGDSTFSIPELSGRRIAYLHWVPETTPMVVQSLVASPGELLLERGSRSQVTVQGRYSDGGLGTVPVRWSSSDPSVASVSESGTVTANTIGAALIEARYAEWLTDTVFVTVQDTDEPEFLLRETFTAEGLAGWVGFGEPRPALLEHQGDTVLSLQGDGRYRDGLISRETFSLDLGATVEVVFRLTLTRREYQNIGLCLENELVEVNEADAVWQGQCLGDGLVLDFPFGNGNAFDPRAARVGYERTRLSEVPRIPEEVDPSEWTQMALQIRPDGVLTLFVNGEPVRRIGFRIAVHPDELWRLRIFGASVDTEVLVRSVTVWTGLRYREGPGSDPG